MTTTEAVMLHRRQARLAGLYEARNAVRAMRRDAVGIDHVVWDQAVTAALHAIQQRINLGETDDV